jgi:cyclin K
LFAPRVIAIACYVLAQRIVDGPNLPSLDARISAVAPSKSLPTPPSNKPPSPDAARVAIEHYNLNDEEISNISGLLDVPHSIALNLTIISNRDPQYYA